jgi:hypothetical protein
VRIRLKLILQGLLLCGLMAAQATGQPKLALAAESNTTFFLENADLSIDFVKDGDGKVTGLIVHQGDQEMKAAIK